MTIRTLKPVSITEAASPNIKDVLILKHNQGMIRDAWIEIDNDHKFLIIRQLNMNGDGSDVERVKLFRLDEGQTQALVRYIAEHENQSST